MKERPIIFSAPMVRAILDGRKTQTRRVVKNQPCGESFSPVHVRQLHDGFQWYSEMGESSVFSCPYGQPGDRLWVREAWRIGSWDEGCGIWLDYCDGARKERLETDPDTAYKFLQQTMEDLRRKKIKPTNETMYEWEPGESPLRWRPSIHMPRWASRIMLEITNVRVERLHDISEADAQAEGAPFELGELERVTLGAKAKYRSGFCRIWHQINGPESWEANPWVWVIEFKRVQP